MTNVLAFLHTTAAYQSAALQLMLGEANFAATQLALDDRVPSNTNGLVEWRVSPPPMGLAGEVLTTNFAYSFERGRLTFIAKRDWLKRAGATNLSDLAGEKSLLDTNTALAFATQALARLQIDLAALPRPAHVLQLPARKVDETGRNLPGWENVVATPVFQISWGPRAAPADFRNPVGLKLLGTTPELLEWRLRERNLSRRPVLAVANAAALLGPLPPPRHFVEELFGGRTAYETVLSPERAEAWLLNSAFTREEVRLPETRQGPVTLPAKLAKEFSGTLLDFSTYHWSVTKLCAPDYGLKLRFSRGTNAVDVRFCFECDILEITSAGQIRTENFDFNHNAFVSMAKRLFPKDQTIQKLEKENEQQARKRFESELQRLATE